MAVADTCCGERGVSRGKPEIPLNSSTSECCHGDLRGMCFVLAKGVTGYVCQHCSGPLYQSRGTKVGVGGCGGKQFEEGLPVMAFERKERLSRQVRRNLWWEDQKGDSVEGEGSLSQCQALESVSVESSAQCSLISLGSSHARGNRGRRDPDLNPALRGIRFQQIKRSGS